MVVYEVNLQVHREILAAFEGWLVEHAREMVSLDGFVSAEILRPFTIEPADAESTTVALVVHYRLRDRASLDRYLANHAARMRQQGSDRFGGSFTASRRLLESERTL